MVTSVENTVEAKSLKGWESESTGINTSKRINSNTQEFLISSDERNNTEISSRMTQARISFQRMKLVLTTNASLSTQAGEP